MNARDQEDLRRTRAYCEQRIAALNDPPASAVQAEETPPLVETSARSERENALAADAKVVGRAVASAALVRRMLGGRG